MLITHAAKMSPDEVNTHTLKVLNSVSETYLYELVKQISIPRHFKAQPQNNRRIARFLTQQLQSIGYQTESQGRFANILTVPKNSSTPCILVGAHYDSVPQTPGADDNASACAALLACAKAVAEYAPQTPVCFVAFNREEDDLMGSKDFVKSCLTKNKIKIARAHILEMVGYCQHTPNSQIVPQGLPVSLPNIGNFLGIIGNSNSNTLVDATLKKAKTYLPAFPVVGLKVFLGLENVFSVLKRSDHAPFWQAKIPALMWTDTAEFRNPNYHWHTDTPETLDYTFLRQVTQLLISCVIDI
jgi:Zn-dependent M28 family amino/carboxypeptidase